MYYKILETLTNMEQINNKTQRKTFCSIINYNFDRWADLGMPSITPYNQWKEPVKYIALSCTLIANVFKLIQAKQGKASFIGNCLQGLAHLMFFIYFLFLSKEPMLAMPKVFGIVMSVLSAYWIAVASNGFL